MKLKSYIGIIISTIGFFLLVGVSFGIYADVGSGIFHLYFISLALPLLLSLYSIIRKNNRIAKISFLLGAFLCLIIIIYLYLIDKHQYTLVYDLYQNIHSIFIGSILFLFGLVLPMININDE
jgi:hypothetical protein